MFTDSFHYQSSTDGAQNSLVRFRKCKYMAMHELKSSLTVFIISQALMVLRTALCVSGNVSIWQCTS